MRIRREKKRAQKRSAPIGHVQKRKKSAGCMALLTFICAAISCCVGSRTRYFQLVCWGKHMNSLWLLGPQQMCSTADTHLPGRAVRADDNEENASQGDPRRVEGGKGLKGLKGKGKGQKAVAHGGHIGSRSAADGERSRSSSGCVRAFVLAVIPRIDYDNNREITMRMQSPFCLHVSVLKVRSEPRRLLAALRHYRIIAL